ncbi:hypothetical protein [Bradyrhizobium icense]|uniref:hypothetical protein n=1 Tax=Bradyrhizobium icense TaxID=1274631 RepID=UPI0012EAB8B5|nr:hypothetical protein [Bradyrhizobium icense]
MLSLLAITADSNACRHPIEVMNPVAPDRIPTVLPGQRQIAIASNSQQQDERGIAAV